MFCRAYDWEEHRVAIFLIFQNRMRAASKLEFGVHYTDGPLPFQRI